MVKCFALLNSYFKCESVKADQHCVAYHRTAMVSAVFTLLAERKKRDRDADADPIHSDPGIRPTTIPTGKKKRNPNRLDKGEGIYSLLKPFPDSDEITLIFPFRDCEI